MEKKDDRRIYFGLILVVLGTLIILGNFDIFDIGDIFSTFWPLIFVLWGVSLLFKDTDKRDAGPELIPVTDAGSIPEPQEEKPPGQVPDSIHKIIGDITVRPVNKPVRSGSYSVLIGEILLDLTNAEPPKEPVRIYLNASIGSVRVMINQKHNLRINSTAILGDISIADQKDSGIQASLTWDSQKAGNEISLNANTLVGDIIIW